MAQIRRQDGSVPSRASSPKPVKSRRKVGAFLGSGHESAKRTSGVTTEARVARRAVALELAGRDSPYDALSARGSRLTER